jgi:hypothetical protein
MDDAHALLRTRKTQGQEQTENDLAIFSQRKFRLTAKHKLLDIIEIFDSLELDGDKAGR